MHPSPCPGVAKNLAAELGKDGIRVNFVSPGGVVSQSNFGVPAEKVAVSSHATATMKGKIPRVKDVEMVTLYLASNGASYMSGLNLVVDGGYSVVNPTMMKAAGLIPDQLNVRYLSPVSSFTCDKHGLDAGLTICCHVEG
ncbi:hypothetical protein RJ639_000555 [Escallonia herrerae]|uniref:Uncharacterized protein n=1 Tax=Escallonia herrerae TaxID=1293975 RepID=A0AA88XCX9_9ASTE|nr:hypothetical protein RJ639_000555 [Escallonia herrerae]